MVIVVFSLSINCRNDKSYKVGIETDAIGRNLASPTTLVLARLIQKKLKKIKKQGKTYNEETIRNIFKSNLLVNYYRETDYSKFCKLLKVDSNYYEILLYPVNEFSNNEEYFICTPEKIFKLDFRKVSNPEKILKVDGTL